MRRRFVMRDGKLVEDIKVQRRNFHNIQPDIKPYWSVASNKLVDGKTQRREDLIRTGCREVDPSEKKDFLREKKHEDFKFSERELHDINKLFDKHGIR